MATEPQDLSRRIFFRRAAIYAASVAIIQVVRSSYAGAQGKVAQSAVAYQDKPKGNQRCDGCSLFEPPKGCKAVEGEISPQGWCSLFTPKA